MKKYLSMLLIALVCLSLVGCAKAKEQTVDETAPAVTAEQPAAEAEAVAAPAPAVQ